MTEQTELPSVQSPLADELFALALAVADTAPGVDRANAKGRLALEVVANLPAILAALRRPDGPLPAPPSDKEGSER
jgi:hypothetical protein